MPIADEFNYIKPASLDEAAKLLDKYNGKTMILAGGTDLANMLKNGFPVPEMMIDIKGISDLKKIEITNNRLFIGSAVTFTEIIESKLIEQHANILWEAAHYVASCGVRNRATMVGNICSAVPCLDSGAPLLVLEADVHLFSSQGERKVEANKWFVDSRKTAIAKNEVVTGVSFHIIEKKYGSCYMKMMRYSGEDLAQANVGIIVTEDRKFKVAFGSVAPTPKRSPKIEHLLNTKGVTKEVIVEAKNMLEQVIAPITDVRATKEYRMQMTKVMLERGIETAIKRLENKTA